MAGFEPSKQRAFFDEVVRSNALAFNGSSMPASVGVNFGKTFFSSVSLEAQRRTLFLIRGDSTLLERRRAARVSAPL